MQYVNIYLRSVDVSEIKTGEFQSMVAQGLNQKEKSLYMSRILSSADTLPIQGRIRALEYMKVSRIRLSGQQSLRDLHQMKRRKTHTEVYWSMPYWQCMTITKQNTLHVLAFHFTEINVKIW